MSLVWLATGPSWSQSAGRMNYEVCPVLFALHYSSNSPRLPRSRRNGSGEKSMMDWTFCTVRAGMPCRGSHRIFPSIVAGRSLAIGKAQRSRPTIAIAKPGTRPDGLPQTAEGFNGRTDQAPSISPQVWIDFWVGRNPADPILA